MPEGKVIHNRKAHKNKGSERFLLRTLCHVFNVFKN